MQPFVTHRGRLAVLDWSDVNTDLIIPARYLKKVERTGFGPLLFADKRYVPGGAPEPENPEQHGLEQPDFPLNSPACQGATVLVVGRNFGCGSSREHAVWAVMQAGFRAVIAPGKGVGFADIFEENAFQNGLLVIELAEGDWQAIAAAGREHPESALVTIDLRDQTLCCSRSEQTINLEDATSAVASQRDRLFDFEVPEPHRHRLLHGLDAIAETLFQEPAISRYEQQLPTWITPKPA
jgi:3-isopropylmalate/(R)-2-methylmalate dehydratase small subunit